MEKDSIGTSGGQPRATFDVHNGNGHANGHAAILAPLSLADRLPPQNLEAERSCLGSVLIDADTLAPIAGMLRVEDFYDDAHRYVFGAMLALRDRGTPVDIITLADELAARGEFDKIGGDDTLRGIVETVPTPANAAYYAGIVGEKSLGRRLIECATQIIRDGYSNLHTSPELLERARAAVGGIEARRPARSDEELGIIRGESVEMGPVEWLWKYRLAVGEMALLAGDGGLGKSTLLLAIAAAITRGLEWPDRSGRAPVGSVIIVSAEDSRETTLKPRLFAMHADMSRIVFVTARITIRRPGAEPMVHPMSLQDRDYWRDVLSRVPDCRAMIVDPVPSYLGRGVNDSRNAELRAVLEPFIELVLRPAGVCLAANTHLNKAVDLRTPLHRISGNTAYGNLPRNVHFVLKHPDDPELRLFKQAKCNNAPDDLPAIAYRLSRAVIEAGGREIETSYPIFEHDLVEVDLREAMGGGRKDRGRCAAAEAFLIECFNRQPQWASEELLAEGVRRGIHRNALFEAKASLGLSKARKIGSVWFWSIPADWAHLAPLAENLETLETLETLDP